MSGTAKTKPPELNLPLFGSESSIRFSARSPSTVDASRIMTVVLNEPIHCICIAYLCSICIAHTV